MGWVKRWWGGREASVGRGELCRCRLGCTAKGERERKVGGQYWSAITRKEQGEEETSKTRRVDDDSQSEKKRAPTHATAKTL